MPLNKEEKTNIKDLKPKSYASKELPFTICARVTWVQPVRVSQWGNSYMKFLLRDETAMIEAVASGNDCIQKFEGLMPTKVYWFSDFDLKLSDQNYCNVNKYTIYLGPATAIIQELDAELLPRESFYTVEDLVNHSNSIRDGRKMDVVGKVIKSLDITHKKIVLGGVDDQAESCRLELTVWKEHENINFNPGEYVVMRQVLVKKNKGTLSLTTLYRTYIERHTSRPGVKGHKLEDSLSKEECPDVEKCPKKDSEDSNMIMPMDPAMAMLYLKALETGTEESSMIRVMVVGHKGAGKTTLVKKLLSIPIDPESDESTEGIDIHVHKCLVKENGEWTPSTGSTEVEMYTRMVSSLSVKSADSGNETMEVDNGEPFDSYRDSLKPFCTVNKNQNNYEQIQTDPLPVNGQCDMNRPIANKTKAAKRRRSFDLSSLNKEDVEKFGKAVKKGRLDYGNYVNVWDFAGQYIFYATHQLFLSNRAIYLLVVDLTKTWEDEIHDDEGTALRKVSDFCEFWVHSIHTFSGGNDSSPPILLVGTHKDLIKQGDEAQDLFYNISKSFSDLHVSKHFHKETFYSGLDEETSKESTNQGDETDKLRKSILQVSKDQAWSSKKSPIKWIPLERELMKKVQVENYKHLTFDEVCELDAKNDKPIEDKEEIKAFLSFHHQLGTLLYFNEEGLSNTVVLDPKWLIKAFTSIITTSRFFELKSKKKLDELWRKINKSAKISEIELEKVWQRNSEHDFYEKKDILLNFMLKLHMLARVNYFDDTTCTFKQMHDFIIPTFLANRSCNTSDIAKIITIKQGTHILAFYFEKSHVSPTIYHHLVANAVGRWQPYEIRRGKHLLYENIAVFKLDEAHVGIIERCKMSVNIMVKTLGSRKKSLGICDRFRRCTEEVLKNEIGHCSSERNIPYKLKVKCSFLFDETDKFTYQDFDELKAVEKLSCTGCNDSHTLVYDDIVRQWFPDLETGFMNYLSNEAKIAPVLEKHTNQLAVIIKDGWELLASHLGLKKIRIERILKDNNALACVCVFELLNDWIKEKDDLATFQVLISAIDKSAVEVDMDNLISFLENI